MPKHHQHQEKGAYHRTMVWLGFRRDRYGNIIDDDDTGRRSLKSSSSKPTPIASRVTYESDFTTSWSPNTIAKMIADEVALAMEKHALAPKPEPPKPLPEVYEADEKLDPFVRRSKPAKWMEAPDVTLAKNVTTPQKTFVTSEHATGHHEKVDLRDPNARQPYAERDYSKYPPGTGVQYGGPSFGKHAADASDRTSDKSTGTKGKATGISTISAASNAIQFCIVVIALSFAPVLIDLTRSVMRKEDVMKSLLRWALTAGATFAMGFVFFGVCRKPFARWLVRVATVTGVSKEGASVAAVGIAFFTGLLGASLTQAASSAIKWLLKGEGWTTFTVSILMATLTPVYMEWRKRRRLLLKRALTVCYDVEKSPDGLAALLMGQTGFQKKDPSKFALGVAESPGWARFREDELTEWLNSFLTRLWPFVNRSVCGLVRSQVEPLLEEHRPGMFKRIHFEKLDLGPEAIRVNGARWVGTRSNGMGASLELDLAWSGRAKIQLNAETHLSTIAIGVKDVEAYTKVMVTLQPLTPTLCPFMGLMVTLREKPTLEFDVDLPLGLEGTVSKSIQDWLETLVENILETTLVWPERLVIPMGDPQANITLPNGSKQTQEWYVENVLKLRDVGLICLKIKRGENVVGTDVLSKADAVVKAKIKGLTWSKTDVVMNSNNPVFNHVMYLLVDDPNERSLTLNVVDADDISSGGFGRDVPIGSAKVSLSEIAKSPHQTTELWVDFPETKEHNMRVKSRPPMRLLCDVTYVPFDLDDENANGVLDRLEKNDSSNADSSADSKNNSERKKSSQPSSLSGVGMLTARVIRGAGLKGADDGGKSSDPFCKLSMPKANVEGRGSNDKKDAIRYKTRTCEKTLDPEWLESFEFVGVRGDSKLYMQCFDRDKGYVAGSSKSSLGTFEVVPQRDVVQYAADKNSKSKNPTRRGAMDKSVVTRTFKLNGDQSIKGGIQLELTWQPFAPSN